jgi:hypothetical protein
MAQPFQFAYYQHKKVVHKLDMHTKKRGLLDFGGGKYYNKM